MFYSALYSALSWYSSSGYNSGVQSNILADNLMIWAYLHFHNFDAFAAALCSFSSSRTILSVFYTELKISICFSKFRCAFRSPNDNRKTYLENISQLSPQLIFLPSLHKNKTWHCIHLHLTNIKLLNDTVQYKILSLAFMIESITSKSFRFFFNM